MSKKKKLVICPYCGHTQTNADRCESCHGYFEPLSRIATQIAMGPWFVRDANNPYRPGCSLDVIKQQIKSGKIKLNTIMRGPTTRQFWTVARYVPGISHLLGYCDACGEHVDPKDLRCPECGNSFLTHDERNQLGLQYATDEAAERASKLLEVKIKTANLEAKAGKATAKAGDEAAVKSASKGKSSAGAATPPPLPKPAAGGDLLDQIIGSTNMNAKPTAGDPGSSGVFEHGSELLEFERQPSMSADAEFAGTADAQVPIAARPISDSTTERTTRVPRRGNRGTVIALVVMNVFLLLAVIGFAIYLFGPNTRSKPQTPGTNGDDSSEQNGEGNEPISINQTAKTRRDEPVIDPFAIDWSERPDPSGQTSPPVNVAEASADIDGVTETSDPPDVETPRSSEQTEPAPDRTANEPAPPANAAMLERIDALLAKDPPDHYAALELLYEYKKITPAKNRPHDIQLRINQLERLIAENRDPTIFDS